MIGKKALMIRFASLRRDDISMRIMNQVRGIAKEKSSLMCAGLMFEGLLIRRLRGLEAGYHPLGGALARL